jgi:membrane protein required for colicin V production
MTGFDLVVIIVVGLAAIGGLMRGFVHEVLALAAWVVALLAIYFFHTDLSAWLVPYVGAQTTAAVLAFALLLLLPYAAMKAIARWAGSKSRGSVLGPVDRVLGLGFGILKGLILVVLAFSLFVLAYDTIRGENERPDWISQARSYAFINAASDALVETIAERRATTGDEPPANPQ